MKKVLFLLALVFQLQALQLKDESGELKLCAKQFLALFDVPDLSPHEIVPYLQTKWWQLNKERWEMEDLFEEKRDAALPFLKELGCIESVHAEKKHYDYALVLGAVGKTMQRRLDFLFEEYQRGVRFDRIVLLTGQRDLDPKLETYPEGLSSETELLVYLFENHPLKKVAPYTVIDSQKEKLSDGKMRRPNTASTIRDWLAAQPSPGSCLAISTQPFVGYQEAVVKFFLSHAFEVEGVGPGTASGYPTANLDLKDQPSLPYPMAIYLDNFAKWLFYENIREVQ